MDVEIRHEGSDITNYVIEYSRNKELCSGIGLLDISIVKTVSRTFNTWDTITIYEEGTKRGEYNISSITRDAKTGNYKLECQDDSKRLVDYFVADSYTVTTYTLTKYWIELILNMAGVNYIFDTAELGTPVNENSVLGVGSAYDVITPLLQQSGWYIYFDENNLAHIGKIDLSISGYTDSFNDNEILNISTMENDAMLRNRAVVYGTGDAYTGTWVYADLSRQTPWNYDNADQRAVVLGNPNIRSTAVANQLAVQILDEFTKRNYVKTIEIVGSPNIEIADTVYINSDYFSGLCLVTTLSVDVNSNGMVTTLILDQRCPRLFGVWDIGTNYVYIGTSGSGVWRKLLGGSTWENFSDGLTNLNVVDLDINAGNFVCVASGGQLFLRNILVSGWHQFLPSGFYNRLTTPPYVMPTPSGGYVACAINRTNNEIYGLFTNNLWSWISTITSSGNYINSLITTLSGTSDFTYTYRGFDVEDINNSLIVTTYSRLTSASGIMNEGTGINRNNLNTNSIASTTYSTSRNLQYGQISVQNPRICWYEQYSFYSDSTKVIRRDNQTGDEIIINRPTGPTYDVGWTGSILDKDNFIQILYNTNSSIKYYVHYNFITETSTILLEDSAGAGQIFSSNSYGAYLLSNGDVRFIDIYRIQTTGGTPVSTNFKYINLSTLSVSSATNLVTFRELYPLPTVLVDWGWHFQGSSYIIENNKNIFFQYHEERSTGGSEIKVKSIVINLDTLDVSSEIRTFSSGTFYTGIHSIASFCDEKFYIVYRVTPSATEYRLAEIDFSGEFSDIELSATNVYKRLVASKFTTYLVYTNGNVSTLAGTGGVSSVPIGLGGDTISSVADDHDNSIIMYKDTSPGKIYRINPGNSITTLYDNWVFGTATITLFLEKILLDSILFSNGEWQTTIYPEAASVLKKQTDTLLYEDIYSKVLETTSSMKLDASLDAPLVLFGNGQTTSYVSQSGDIDTYILLNNDKLIYDAKYFTSSSGVKILFATSSGVYEFPYTGSSGISLTPVYSGSFKKLETNNHNYYSYPYIFIGTSGSFLQRNPDTEFFTSYSAGLPSNEITVIRMDDSL